MEKRGISGVVTVVLIILFGIVAVAIIGGVVVRQVRSSGDRVVQQQICNTNTVDPISCTMFGPIVKIKYKRSQATPDVISVINVSLVADSSSGSKIVDGDYSVNSVGDVRLGFVSNLTQPAQRVSVATTFVTKDNKRVTCESQKFACGGQAIPSDFFIYMPFDGDTKDYSGNGFSAGAGFGGGAGIPFTFDTLRNASGYFGRVLKLTAGSNQYADTVDLNSPLPYSGTTHTYSFWLNFTVTVSSIYRVLFYKCSSVGCPIQNDRNPLMITPNPASTKLFSMYFNGGYVSGPLIGKDATNAFDLNTWYHVVETLDSNKNVKMYVNGVFISQGNLGVNPLTVGSGALRIGSPSSNPSVALGDLIIYNRALSETEVQQIFTEQRGKFGV